MAKVRYTAQFTKDPFTTITSIPPGLELKVNGKKVRTPYRDTWPAGTPLDIEAPTQPGVFPNSGTEYQVLKSWSRAQTAGPDPIVATFSAVHSVRWVAPRIGDGTVTFSPALLPGNLVAGDTELTITAVPGAGSGFISWGDSLSGSDPSVKIKVNSDLVISARFGVVGLLSAAGTVNAASQLRSPLSPEGFTQIIVAPGQMISLYGAAIGPATTTEVPFPFASNARDLHQTEVLFNGVSRAPVTYVSPNQINCIVPFGVNGKDVPIQVILAGRRSNELKVTVQAAVPALFTANSSGLGPGVIRNVDGSPNSPSNRAARGSQVTIYATGTGRTTPASLDGEIIRADAPPPSPELPIKVFIADREVKITSPAVSVPGSVNGLTVLTVLVPDEKTIGPGIVPIVIQVGEFRSPRTASIAVK
ncbi:MAG: hypothetical protein NTV52_12495 [Acidobacteria bacterium]|nr:hypothetical protein [Acidobacteriota bacterium]